MKKIISVLTILLVSFTTSSASAKENFVDKTLMWWKKITPETLENFIKEGSDIYQKDQFGYIAWQAAIVASSDPNTIDVLIKNGVDIKTIDKNRDTILMQVASKNKNLKVIESLIKNGVDVNAQGYHGWTALSLAAWNNENPEIIEILIKHGANLEAKDDDEKTPLMYAASNSNVDILKTLIHHGANINTKRKYGLTVLHEAMHNTNPIITEFLIEKGMNVNIKSDDGSTPLITLCFDSFMNNTLLGLGNVEYQNKKKSSEIVKAQILIQNGADVNAKNNKGKTALMEAVNGLNFDLISFLLQNGAKINEVDERDWTALIYASGRGNVDIINFLIQNGANINAQTNDGQTALMRASMHNENPKVIETFINHGANVTIKDKFGKTALDYAKENPHIYRTDSYWFLANKMDSEKVRVKSYDALNCTIEHNKEVCEEFNLQPFTGVAMFYHFGNVLSKASYKNGLVDGIVKAYDAIDGHLYLEADYNQGELLKATCYDKYGKVIQCRCDMFNWRIKRIMNQCR